MKFLVVQLESLLICLGLLVINALILTILLSANPSWLIENRSYLEQNKTLLTYLLKGNDNSISPILSPNEFSHIRDVRNIFKFLPYIAGVSLLFTYIASRAQQLSVITNILKRAIVVLISFTAIVLALFTSFFEYFHYALFPQGNWSFPENSLLIQLYPEDFWKTVAAIILIASLAQLGIIFAFLKTNTNNHTLAEH